MDAVSAEIEPSLTARRINLQYFYAYEVLVDCAQSVLAALYATRLDHFAHFYLRDFAERRFYRGKCHPAFAVLLYRTVYFR